MNNANILSHVEKYQHINPTCVYIHTVTTHYEDIKGDTKYQKWGGLR